MSHVQADLEEMLIILKELDIASRKKNHEKAAVKKKLSQKQQQLQNAAKSSKKITDFFSRKKQPPVARVGRKEDSMMDWEDDTMEWDDFPTLGWTEILKMEKNREKAKRWRRARIQKQDLLQTLEKKSKEREEMSEWIKLRSWTPGRKGGGLL